MTTKEMIFIGVMAYSFIAVGLLWGLGLKEHFGWFCVVAIAGIPLPFAIEKICQSFGG